MEQGPRWVFGKPDELARYDAMSGRRLELAEAREAEELHGVYRDLEFVIQTTEYLIDLIEQEEEQASGLREVPIYQAPTELEADLVTRSLWTAALVAYVRCFTSGKRVQLNESIFDGQPYHVLEWHRYFKNMRDKHIAHSVNPFEETATGVYVTDLQQAPKVQHVFTVSGSLSSEPSAAVENLRELATWVQRIAGQQFHEAMCKVLDKAKTLTPEQLRALKPLELTNPHGFDAARTPRT